MHLIKREDQYRRDFTGLFYCEHCGHQQHERGYDDQYFHSHIIPTIRCNACDKPADPDNIITTTPKFAPWAIV